MTYELTQTPEGYPCIIVNSSIYFAWDESDTDTYGLFLSALASKGIEAFAVLLEQDASTAFLTFCNE